MKKAITTKKAAIAVLRLLVTAFRSLFKYKILKQQKIQPNATKTTETIHARAEYASFDPYTPYIVSVFFSRIRYKISLESFSSKVVYED